MNAVRRWVRNLFGFSAAEINGFIILIPLMLIFVLSEPAYHSWSAARIPRTQRDSVQLDSLIGRWQPTAVPRLERFNFDPNSADHSALKNLGFSDISAKRIAAYRSKGGVFRTKSDLLKIYGLDSSLYNQLYAYISLPEILPVRGRKNVADGLVFQKKSAPAFDINTADTLQLKSVYGIGSIFAARIIKFRDRLGGFVTPGQYYQVYGLDTLTVKELQRKCFIKADFVPRKININTSGEKVLSDHPYIRSRLARILVSYRFQHGDFLEVSDIKNLSAIKPEEVERLLPYIKVKE